MAQVNELGDVQPEKDRIQKAIDDAKKTEVMLVNLLTALVDRAGGEVQITSAELSGLSHVFQSAQDPATGTVTLTARKKSAAASALTAEQERHNRMANEVALPKPGAIIAPSRPSIILPGQ